MSLYNAIAGSCAEQKANATTAPAYTLDGIALSSTGSVTGTILTELVNGPDELLLAVYSASSIKSYSFDDSAVPSFSSADDTLSIGNNSSRALVFGDSGNYIYIGGTNASTNIVRYALSTAYDIGTTGSTQTVNSSLYSSGAQGLAFNDTGTKLFVADGSSVITLTLNTAWDLSAGSKTTNNLSSTTDDDGDNITNYTGIRFNPAGTKMFISYRNSAGNPASASANHPKIAEFDLSTGFNVSTASFARSMSVNDDIGQLSTTASTFIGGFDWNSDGTKLFVAPVHADALSGTGPIVCRYTF
ncbi:hypothetical protein OAA37_00130 [bacterium]|jgi:hypothetical protein|nr:hypothetical protein [bacterium]MDB4347860.1 hypothetical protein [bacterium]